MILRSLTVTLAAVGLVLAPAAAAAAGTSVTRLPAVILVSGDSARLVDALTAAPLAGVLGVPLVYTAPGGGLTPAGAATIRDLNPEAVIVVGGTSVVTDDAHRAAIAESTPRAAGQDSTQLDSVRLAGADRYGTADAVARYLRDLTYAGSGRQG